MPVLGVDVSTSKVGFSVLDKDENILYNEVLKFKKGEDLILKGLDFENKVKEIKEEFVISAIIVEKAFIAFSGGGGQAMTTALLQRFNGIACFILFKVFNIIPELVSPISARSKLGIPRTKKQRKKLSTIEKKKPIIEFVSNYYKNSKTPFTYKLTPMGNAVPGTDDLADSIVLSLYHLRS